MKLIVMAGGQGTKLWPYSTEDHPKQFQNIFGEETLFQNTVRSLLKSFKTEDIYVSTKKRYINFVLDQTPEIPKEQIIAEPDVQKNQGPATIYAAMKVAHDHPDEPFMLIQSDCLRDPEDAFLEMIVQAEKIVKKDKRLLSGGNRPLSPMMGIDYFRLADRVQTIKKLQVYEVEKFVYRPDTYEGVRDLIENFHVVTHSNHISWYADLLLKETKKRKPQWFEKLNEIKTYFGKDNEEEMTEKLYSEIEDGGNIEEVISPVFEKNGVIVILPFKWIDVGTWSSIYDNLSNPGKNYIDANVVTIDTNNTLIKAPKDKLIATLGVDDLVIVDTGKSLLICKKNRAGDIKQILKNLEESGRDEYL